MSFFDDANAFMRRKQAELESARPASSLYLTPQECEQKRSEWVELLKREFDNATTREINHALDLFIEKSQVPRDFKHLLREIRIYLED